MKKITLILTAFCLSTALTAYAETAAPTQSATPTQKPAVIVSTPPTNKPAVTEQKKDQSIGSSILKSMSDGWNSMVDMIGKRTR